VTEDPTQAQAAPAAGSADLVTVLETGDWVEISLVSGLLESAAIPYGVRAGKDISNQGVYYVLVAAENEADARAVLAPPDEAELAGEAEQAGNGEEAS
jgi:hypothetical protein